MRVDLNASISIVTYNIIFYFTIVKERSKNIEFHDLLHVQTIRDTLGDTDRCHQMSHGGEKGSKIGQKSVHVLFDNSSIGN